VTTTRFSNLQTAYEQSGYTPLSPWILYFHASAEWLNVWTLLRDNVDNMSMGGPFFYSKPHVLHFSLELIVKARIAYSDMAFNPKTNSHKTSLNIIQHQSVSPIFRQVAADQNLMNLIREYENTVDTRFGETIVQNDGDDEELTVKLVREIRDEMILMTSVSPLVSS